MGELIQFVRKPRMWAMWHRHRGNVSRSNAPTVDYRCLERKDSIKFCTVGRIWIKDQCLKHGTPRKVAQEVETARSSTRNTDNSSTEHLNPFCEMISPVGSSMGSLHKRQREWIFRRLRSLFLSQCSQHQPVTEWPKDKINYRLTFLKQSNKLVHVLSC